MNQEQKRSSNRMALSGPDVQRAISRIAHEIVERNHGAHNVVLVGLQRGGTWIADALAERIYAIEPELTVPNGSLDVSMHRDDIGIRPIVPGAISDISFDINGAIVVLVDDVLYTGRTVRAARLDNAGIRILINATFQIQGFISNVGGFSSQVFFFLHQIGITKRSIIHKWSDVTKVKFGCR